MVWHDLLFAHWPVPAGPLRERLPEGLQLDTFEGQAWLGIVPFRMTGIRPRGLFAVPGLSAFPELNVRTYVTAGGKPGVWFFSLDAGNRPAVRIARSTFHLPYFDAEMDCAAEAGGISYKSRRTHRGAPSADFHASYAPTGEIFASRPGTLEEWLTERYCLYSSNRSGRVFRGDIDHVPWPLQPATAQLGRVDLTRILGTTLPDTEPHLLFARRLDVVAWWLEPVA